MKDAATCSCVRDMAKSFSRLASKDQEESELYQTSPMSALIDGVYDGDKTIEQLLQHGDFGLGIFDELDGELVAFDSKVHQLREDGSARRAPMDQKTPFAVVTNFRPTMFGTFGSPLDKSEVHEILDELIGSPNLFCAFRIDGQFERVETRTVPRQTMPYRPILEAIERQPVFTFKKSSGTRRSVQFPRMRPDV